MSKLRIKYFNCTLEIIWLNCTVLLTSSHSTLPSFHSFLTFFCHFEIHFSPRWPGKFCTLKQKYNSFKTYFWKLGRFDINLFRIYVILSKEMVQYTQTWSLYWTKEKKLFNGEDFHNKIFLTFPPFFENFNF